MKTLMRARRRFGMLIALISASLANAATLSFEQLDLFGISSSTSNSSWGRLTFEYEGTSDIQYFNLSVNGNWVVRNMGVQSLFGEGILQQVGRLFDLGIAPGFDVTTLGYVVSFGPDQLASTPTGPETVVGVSSLAFQIGGEDAVDLGSLPPPVTGSGAPAALVSSGSLPGIETFTNQEQGAFECVPGAISNSFRYLQSRGGLPAGLDTSIATIKGQLPQFPTGTGSNWPTIKAGLYSDLLQTRFFEPGNFAGLIAELNAGQDVELDLQGHAAFIVGARLYADGRRELDIFDDNQLGDGADPMRTVEIIGGNVDGMLVERYVVECPVPEPSTYGVLGAALLIGIVCVQKRRRKKGGSDRSREW